MRARTATPAHSRLELDGQLYVVLRRGVFEELCRRAGISVVEEPGSGRVARELADWAADPVRLGRRLADRRKRVRVTQAQLAEGAGIRVETLNRIERGHTNPDFGTLRRLVTALLAFDTASARTAVGEAAERD